MSAKTWLITGANSGFGRLMTEQLLARGDRVAATVRRQEELDDLKARYDDRLWVTTLDLTDMSSISETVEAAFDVFQQIDVIVSNAGYVLFGAVEELTIEQIQHQLNTNLLGSILLIKSALPHLRAQGHGRIVQVSSEGGQMTYPALSIYHASKWGIEGFCEALSRETAALNIQIMLVEPANTPTNFNRNAITPSQFIDAYQQTTVGNYRRLLAMGRFPCKGDPVKISKAIIHAADGETMPRRLALGSDAYKNIYKALTERLKELEAQETAAALADQSK